MNRRFRICATIAFVLTSPAVAFANSGTPLMWARMLHLAVGNALIGIVEGLLLALIFKCARWKSVGWLVLANYVSMGAGMVFGLGPLETWAAHLLGDRPLQNAVGAMVTLSLIVFAATLIIEWPFCLFALSGKPGRFWKSAVAVVGLHVASYGVLIPFYISSSSASVCTQTRVESTPSFSRSPDARVYFISPDDGSVCRIRTDGSNREVVSPAILRTKDTRLFARRNDDDSAWDLYATDSRSPLVESFTRGTPSTWESADGNAEGSGFSFETADLRLEGERAWKVRPGFWAIQGIHAEHEVTGESLRVAMETPFFEWFSRNATVLPGDQVVYQLDDMIVLLDLNTRQIAQIVRGRGPLVVVTGPPNEGGTR